MGGLDPERGPRCGGHPAGGGEQKNQKNFWLGLAFPLFLSYIPCMEIRSPSKAGPEAEVAFLRRLSPE